MTKKKRSGQGADRTKYTATPRRGHPEPRPRAWTGPVGTLLILAFGGVLLAGAVQWTPKNLGTLAATAGWTGARGELQVQDCIEHPHYKGRPSYSCSGPITPREAAPAAERGVAWIVGQTENPSGKTVGVDCPATSDICVRTGTHAVLAAVLQAYILLGLYVVGLIVLLVMAGRRWPGAFRWFIRHRERYLTVAGWTGVGLAASLIGVLIGVVAF